MSGLEPLIASLMASAAPAAGASAAMGTGAAMGLGGVNALLAGEAAAGGLTGLGSAAAGAGLLGKGLDSLSKASAVSGLLGGDEPPPMPANPAILGAVQQPPTINPTPAEFYQTDEQRKKKMLALMRAKQMGLA